jgi:phage baseplate assembly protein W
MAEQIFYRDLSLNPTVNSEGDIATVTNRDSIKQALKMLLNTGKGSRIFMPDYGCRIRGFLFEMFDETTAKRLGNEIQETIKNYEPRVEILNVTVDMLFASSSYDVSVLYRIVNTNVVDSYKVSLEKL